jgi:hypothetical protein
MPIILNNKFFLSCDEMWENRGGTPWAMDGHREYTRQFRVVVKMKQMAPIAVALCPLLPQPGSIYLGQNGVEYDLLANLTSYDCKQESGADWQNWIVLCKYSTRQPAGGPSDGKNADHPENEPAEIKWDSESIQIAPFVDLFGTPYLCSNDRPYSPPVTYEYVYPVLTITRNELAFSVDLADRYTNALNDRTFLGWPVWRVMSVRPTAERKWRGKLPYWRVTYKLKFRRRYAVGQAGELGYPKDFILGEGLAGSTRKISKPFHWPDGSPDTWQPRILNAALTAYKDKPVGFVGPPKPGEPPHEDGVPDRQGPFHIFDIDGKRVSSPRLLDAFGRVQTARDQDPKSKQLIPTYISYYQYHQVDLSKLLTVGVGKPIYLK